jgi:hypothetical protein
MRKAMLNDLGSGHRRRKLFFAPVIILLLFVLSGLVQFLWNAVLPPALHVGTLSYWQAAGLLLLCRILFGSFHFGRHGGRPPFGGRSQEMREKWMNMNDDERARFKEKLRERCRSHRH